jgi:hypothetical protein
MSVVAQSCIELQASPNEYIRLGAVERFSDSSGFAGNLSLRSGAFCLTDYRFFFDGLERFLTDLQQLYQSLSGSARLQTSFEEPYFELSGSPRGRVWVHGHIVSSADHRLDFGFVTDQTFLPPMINSVKAVLAETRKT